MICLFNTSDVRAFARMAGILISVTIQGRNLSLLRSNSVHVHVTNFQTFTFNMKIYLQDKINPTGYLHRNTINRNDTSFMEEIAISYNTADNSPSGNHGLVLNSVRVVIKARMTWNILEMGPPFQDN